MSSATLANPAEVYQTFFVPTLFTPLSRIFLRYAAPRPGERMLDLACGAPRSAVWTIPERTKGGEIQVSRVSGVPQRC